MLNQDVHCTPYILELIFAGRPYPDTSSGLGRRHK
jgi:hypothetical protein